MNAVPPGVEGSADARQDTPIDYEAFQAQPEFQELKSRFRRFTFPLAVAFILWFLAFVLLGAYNHEFMARPFLGMNVGLWLGLAQFITTFGITMWYVAFANRRLDPASTALRAELEELAAPHDAPNTTDGGIR
ncbi:DUF485 domain-containing protein [Leucobacter komagatae]|uniref:DUF485 domain-containing protein n=1 Tax=Leucobacter komagatae TaxID=55969 RepID=UPI0005AD10FD|nr:DUF485 domain-containing protein [Leucobacter komagatae]